MKRKIKSTFKTDHEYSFSSHPILFVFHSAFPILRTHYVLKVIFYSTQLISLQNYTRLFQNPAKATATATAARATAPAALASPAPLHRSPWQTHCLVFWPKALHVSQVSVSPFSSLDWPQLRRVCSLSSVSTEWLDEI